MSDHTQSRLRTAVVAACVLAALAACESERAIPLRQSNGAMASTPVPCVGVAGKRKMPGVDYDWSLRNTILGALGSELFLIPPLVVLHHEFFCPTADTTRRRSSTPTDPTS